MDYRVRDGEKEYGPFTLAELHAEIQSGRIPASALVQSQGMTDWMTAAQVLGNIPIPPAEPRATTASLAPPFQREPLGLPPNLHWAIVLIIVILTQQLFNFVWALVLANWARKVERDNKPLVLVAMYPTGLIAGGIAMQNGHEGVGGLLVLGGLLAYLIGVFTVKAAIETYYQYEMKRPQALSGVGTLFLSTVYLQYHINRLAQLRKSLQLATAP